MLRLSIRSVINALFVCSIAACSTPKLRQETNHEPRQVQASLPVNAEPDFKRINSGMLPSGTQVTYLLDGLSIEELLKSRFPALRSVGGKLRAGWEDLVLANGTPFRRMMFYYSTRDDLEEKTMHGPCGQSILVWFNFQGDVAGIYTSQKSCPL